VLIRKEHVLDVSGTLSTALPCCRNKTIVLAVVFYDEVGGS
jgi:hypothetical protein